MYDDNHFFTGIINTTNFNKVVAYQSAGASSDPSFLVKGVLSIELFNSALKLVEVWVSSLNA
jgi:hypothetical protein